MYESTPQPDGTRKDLMVCMIRINRFGTPGDDVVEDRCITFMTNLAKKYAAGGVSKVELYEAREIEILKLKGAQVCTSTPQP